MSFFKKRKPSVLSPYFPTASVLFIYLVVLYPSSFVGGFLSINVRCFLKTYKSTYFMGLNGEDHNPHLEIPLEYGSSGGITSPSPLPHRTSSELFKRKKQVKAKKKKVMDSPSGNLSEPVTEDDIVHHVASKYVTGPGGVLFTSEMKRKKSHDGRVASNLFEIDKNENNQYTDFLKKLDKHPALVLNANYQPLSVLPLSLWPWQETIKSLFSGKVVVVDVYPDIFIQAVNMKVPLPSVIALTDFIAQPDQKPAFTRRNVYLRDNYRCQYCGHFFRTENLSLDHVMPRCVGGKLEWENTVTSCLPCNGRKGSKLPKELKHIGMSLIRQPTVPTKYDLAREANKFLPRKIHPTWNPYLGLTSVTSYGSLDDTIPELSEIETDILSYFMDHNKKGLQ